ncbi:MAG: DUF2156 domain-containing protein [Halomonadaceae bacterium]|nr:MAG: DUF2156 domain-containing protein [Halomonadaceae bacterium]
MTSISPSERLFASALSRESSPSLEDCQELLSRYGNQSSAYFTLQQGARRFGVPGLGYIAYQPVAWPGLRFNVVFANPVCDPRSRPWLMRAFLNKVPGRHLFIGIDQTVAAELGQMGLHINEFGTEFTIDSRSFTVRGKDKKQIRHAANLARRAPVEVREESWQDVTEGGVEGISRCWSRHKAVGNRELSLLTRPPVMGDEWQVRKFYGYLEGELLGYVFFDPYFREGQVIGYTANILRQDTDRSPAGLLDYIILQAMEKFHQEGVFELSLGIAPLHNITAIPGDRWLLRRIGQGLYNHGNRFYAFKALSYHKSRYRGQECKWYMASDRSSALSIAWSILQGTGVLQLPGLTRPSPA